MYKPLFISLTLLLAGCSTLYFAERIVTEKQPKVLQSKLATQAVNTFWTTFQSGDFQHWNNVNQLLTAAYLENPHDPQLSRLVGFSHIWRVSERSRLKQDPTITDHIHLAEQYFTDAEILAPDDARITGFLGSAMMAAANVTMDKKKQVRGYFKLRDGIKAWPEFNYFTAGYTLNNLTPLDERFAEGVDYQWKNIDVCLDQETTPANLTPKAVLAFYQNNPKHTMPENKVRACYNTDKAPHNVEGFFMNMGDMLLKQKKPRLAKQAYEVTAALPDFNKWPHKDKLQQRLANFTEISQRYQGASTKQDYQQLDIKYQMFRSAYSCMACHQAQ